MPNFTLLPLAHLPGFIGRVTNAYGRHYATYSKAVRTGAILAQMRQAHYQALQNAVGPIAAARAAEDAVRACLTPEENRRRTASQHRAMWAGKVKQGRELAIQATKLTKMTFLEGPSLQEFFSPRESILTNAECLPILADMVATAESMTEQELRWIPAARDLIGAEPKDLLQWPCVKRAKGAARGAGTGRPRKVRPGSAADAARIQATHAPVASGPREVGVDGRVGNLPVKVAGCSCAGYGFNGSVTCAGHGFAVRGAQDLRHPLAKGNGSRVDSYRDGRIATVGSVASTDHCPIPWAQEHGRPIV